MSTVADLAAPVSQAASDATDETDRTYFLDNEEFLRALFGTDSAESRPLVVSFEGPPGTVSATAWAGCAWEAGHMPAAGFDAAHNNYFTLATFHPDEAGRFRRRKDRFVGLHAVMLDDAGTKVPMDRLTLPPTWLLETSPGNHQAGYLLAEPLRDGAAADRLMKAIIEAGLCDPGAGGPRARLARLPVGVNGKHTPPFASRLQQWAPERRYTVEQLVSGLQIEMRVAGRPKRGAQRPAQDRPAEAYLVWIPRPDENAVVVALRALGIYKVRLGGGKHDITCPWVHEHTGQVDGGTAYFEPDDSYPIGGFKCQHGHCAGRHVRDLLSFLGVEVDAARMKPTIRLVPGEIHRIVDAAEHELALSGRHYQRGGLIVTVVTDPGTAETRVQEITAPALVRALAGAAVWERFDGRVDDWVRVDPPARHAAVLFDSASYLHLPVLRGLTRQPHLRDDGSLMTAPGYDAASGMFGVFDRREFSVSERPTRDQAMDALAQLDNLLAEFKFPSGEDRAAALSAVLTAAVRPSLARAPMFHVRAHMVGSGKSYLCELITAFATPQRGTPTAFPVDDEECRKLLLAELLRAPAVIEFDNLTSDLVAHKSLCTALTSGHMTGRILGVSKMATVNTRALFLSSGNNVGPVQDMARRCITIKLDPACEVPAARTFSRPDLVSEVLRDRGRFVSLALTIVRAWIVAGRPMQECRPLAGFGEWSDLCRQPLMWLGLSDPTASVFKALSEDPDRETLGRLLTAWQGAIGRGPAMVRDAVNRASTFGGANDDLREVLHDIADERGEINRRRLGWWIRRHAGRIVDGRRFVRASGNRSAEAWQVESVSSVSSVSSFSMAPATVSVSGTVDGGNAYARASRGS